MSDVSRRDALQLLAGVGVAGCTPDGAPPPVPATKAMPSTLTPSGKTVLKVEKLRARPPWKTRDPFLFCVHHDDAYPRGNEQFGPAASLAGRQMGMDFAGKDGWRMYHGRVVPGFPQHPHRGFETVTVVRRGLLDHADSMGAAARYGQGDVQWLTAGKGILHAEMFPLLERERVNPVELFQIWLNLPARDKMVEPHFTMLWAPRIPRVTELDAAGKAVRLTIEAGGYKEHRPPPPPPHSYAARPEADVAIWTIELDAGATWTMPAARPGTDRTLYFFRGESMTVDGSSVQGGHQLELRGDNAVNLVNGPVTSELLLLQGRPIGEPVVKQGPFVMNTRAEIQQAYADYRRTQFGGWPWERNDPVHGATPERFARHATGRLEKPV